MSRRLLPSLEPILAEVRTERAAQLRHSEALDQKAGILLGFAGALVALVPPAGGVIVNVGRAFAVIAASSALSAFWPRTYRMTNLRVLRDRYLAAEDVFTLRQILDAQIHMTQETFKPLRSKARRVKLAMTSLAVATTLVALGLGVA